MATVTARQQKFIELEGGKPDFILRGKNIIRKIPVQFLQSFTISLQLTLYCPSNVRKR
jgi:hypothetical protein